MLNNDALLFLYFSSKETVLTELYEQKLTAVTHRPRRSISDNEIVELLQLRAKLDLLHSIEQELRGLII